jgi:hypothetical protein
MTPDPRVEDFARRLYVACYLHGSKHARFAELARWVARKHADLYPAVDRRLNELLGIRQESERT